MNAIYINSRGKLVISAPYSDVGVEITLEQLVYGS